MSKKVTRVKKRWIEHRTVVGSIFFSKAKKLALPKNKEEFLWVDEGLCPQCYLSSIQNNILVTSCNICGKHLLGLDN